MEDSIVVCVRIRPPNNQEKIEKHDLLTVIDETTVCFDPSPQYDDEWTSDFKRKQAKQDLIRHRGVALNKDKVFGFDRVFGMDSTQKEVYENSAADVVHKVLNGYNATVFAYGATGSGKTYTMVGSDSNSGVMVRTLDDIFIKIKESSDRHYSVNVSYLEIYNEQIHDLLETKSVQGIGFFYYHIYSIPLKGE